MPLGWPSTPMPPAWLDQLRRMHNKPRRSTHATSSADTGAKRILSSEVATASISPATARPHTFLSLDLSTRAWPVSIS